MVNYVRPAYTSGSPNMAAAGISNVVVKSSDLKSGGGSFVYSGPQSTTTTPTNYPITGTSQNLATHATNARIQSNGDSLTGGIKSKRNKRKKNKSNRRKSRRRSKKRRRR